MYRFYISDTLKMIAENTAHQAGGNAPSIRYCDVLERATTKQETQEEQQKQADEIIARMQAKLFGGGEGNELV